MISLPNSTKCSLILVQILAKLNPSLTKLLCRKDRIQHHPHLGDAMISIVFSKIPFVFWVILLVFCMLLPINYPNMMGMFIVMYVLKESLIHKLLLFETIDFLNYLIGTPTVIVGVAKFLTQGLFWVFWLNRQYPRPFHGCAVILRILISAIIPPFVNSKLPCPLALTLVCALFIILHSRDMYI